MDVGATRGVYPLAVETINKEASGSSKRGLEAEGIPGGVYPVASIEE